MEQPFISKFLHLKEIPEINGWGVFTDEDIEENMVIEISPIFFYPQKLLSISIFMAVAEGIKENEIGIDQYSIGWPSENEPYQKSAVMMGYLSLYNHSNSNNASFFSDFTNRLMGITTIKQIRKGEQVTVSYGPEWFDKKKGYLEYISF